MKLKYPICIQNSYDNFMKHYKVQNFFILMAKITFIPISILKIEFNHILILEVMFNLSYLLGATNIWVNFNLILSIIYQL